MQVAQNDPTRVLENIKKLFFKLVGFFLRGVIKGSEQKLKLFLEYLTFIVKQAIRKTIFVEKDSIKKSKTELEKP